MKNERIIRCIQWLGPCAYEAYHDIAASAGDDTVYLSVDIEKDNLQVLDGA